MGLLDVAVVLSLATAIGIAQGLARDRRLGPEQRRLPGPPILWAVVAVALFLIGMLIIWTRIES